MSRKINKILEKLSPQAFVSLGGFHSGGFTLASLTLSMCMREEAFESSNARDSWWAQNQLLLHQFLSGIPEDISKPIRAASKVKSLEQAVVKARLLMAVDSNNPMQ